MHTIKIFRYYLPAHDENPDNGGGDGGDGSPKTFTQDDLNKMLAEDRRKHQNVVSGLQAEIEALSKRTDLTAKDRQEMEKRLEDLHGQLLTKEELAKQEKEKLLKEKDSLVTNLSTERDTWRNRYETMRVVSALSEAATKHNAFNPKQVVTMLRENTRVVEVKDGEKATGDFEIMVKLDTTNDKGERVVLDLTPDQAVKHLTEQDDYLNLFKSESSSGFGGQRNTSGKKLDPVELAKDPAKYREARQKGLI